MAVPKSPRARLFYRAAFGRLEEAGVLSDAGYPTGAVYLAGYGVECALKALILAAVPRRRRAETGATFKGNRAHDFEWLVGQYRVAGGPPLPNAVVRDLRAVSTWSTAIRYSPAWLPDAQATAFLRAAENLLQWADGRLT